MRLNFGCCGQHLESRALPVSLPENIFEGQYYNMLIDC